MHEDVRKLIPSKTVRNELHCYLWENKTITCTNRETLASYAYFDTDKVSTSEPWSLYAIDVLNVFFLKEALLHQNIYVHFTGGLIKTHMPTIHGWMEVSVSHKAQGFSEGPEHTCCRTADAVLQDAKHRYI